MTRTVIGLSTHNEKQFREALRLPANYVALGPIFGTKSKSNPDPDVGLQTLSNVRPLTNLPLVAIGGIGLREAEAVLASGADSIAVISDLLPSEPGDLKALERRAAEWLNRTRIPGAPTSIPGPRRGRLPSVLSSLFYVSVILPFF